MSERPVRWDRVFASAALGSFVVTVNVSTLNVAFPDLEATFPSADRSDLSWVVNGYSVVFAAVLVPAGRLADRIGRRKVFGAGLAIFGVASLLVGLAPQLGALIAARAVQGVGGALLLPASLGLLLAVTPPARRTSTVAAWGALGSLGIATGPSVGALIVDQAGWRWAFLLLPPITLAAWLIGRDHHVDPEPDPDAPMPDLIGSVVLMVAMAAAVVAVVESRVWGPGDPRLVAAVVVAVVGLVIVLVRGRTHPAPVVPASLLRARGFVAANLGALLFSLGLGGTLLVNILFLTEVWGYSILGAGLASTPAPLVVTFVSPLAGRLGDRVGQRPVAVPGALIFAAGIAWYRLRVGTEPAYWTEWFPGNVAAGIGIGAALSMFAAAAVVDVSPDRYALAGGVVQTGRQLGSGLGVAMVVAAVGTPAVGQELAAYQDAWELIVAAALAATVAALGLAPARGRASTHL